MLGTIYWQQGKISEAAGEMQAALGSRPGYSEAWYLLGAARRQRGNLPEAAKAIREAIRLDPHNPDCYTVLADILKRQGDDAGSRAMAARAAQIQREKRSQQAAAQYLSAGAERLEKGDLAGAEQQFRLALASAPNWDQAKRYLEETERRKKAAQEQ